MYVAYVPRSTTVDTAGYVRPFGSHASTIGSICTLLYTFNRILSVAFLHGLGYCTEGNTHLAQRRVEGRQKLTVSQAP